MWALFQCFQTWFKTVISMTRKMKIVNSLSMNETLSWSYEWNLIVWTNWIIFHNTRFAPWNISTLFFRNKIFKGVKETFHRISRPLEILQNSQEDTFSGLSTATLLKKRLWHRCFPVNFAKLLRTPFYRTPLDDCF